MEIQLQRLVIAAMPYANRAQDQALANALLATAQLSS